MHIVLMQLSDQIDDHFFAKVADYAERIRNECNGVVMYHFGENIADRAMGYNYVTSSAFTDSATHDAYQISPAHVGMKTFMAEYIEKIIVFDGVMPTGLGQNHT